MVKKKEVKFWNESIQEIAKLRKNKKTKIMKTAEEKELQELIESVIVPSGYKTVYIGRLLEVSASQFLEKKQVERLAKEISDHHQQKLAEVMPSEEQIQKLIDEKIIRLNPPADPYYGTDYNNGYERGFEEGAEWMRNKLTQEDK